MATLRILWNGAILVAACALGCRKSPARGPDGLTEPEARLIASWMHIALVTRVREAKQRFGSAGPELKEIGEALGEDSATIFEHLLRNQELREQGAYALDFLDVRNAFEAYSPLAFASFQRTIMQQSEAGPLQRVMREWGNIYSGRSSTTRGVQYLPRNLVAPEGQVTLVADFEAMKDGTVPIYVVNRTKDMIWLQTQESDPFLRLETLTGDGWRLAWPYWYSGCGNSQGAEPIRPQTWMQYQARFPHFEFARAATVRFRAGELVSNGGSGFVVLAGPALAALGDDSGGL